MQNPKLTVNHNVLCFAGALGNLQTLKVDENHLVELPDSIGRYYYSFFSLLLSLLEVCLNIFAKYAVYFNS